ncbi:MAG: hypothetical protein AAGH60_09435 [Pseudomonadota bacterium]
MATPDTATPQPAVASKPDVDASDSAIGLAVETVIDNAEPETSDGGFESVERFSQALWNNIRELRAEDPGLESVGEDHEIEDADLGSILEGSALASEQQGQPAKKRSRKVRLKKTNSMRMNLPELLRASAPGFVAVGLIVMALAYPLRDTVVRAVPDLAGVYALAGVDVNVHGVELAGFVAVRETVAGLPIMRIEGEISNDASVDREIPILRISLLNEAGQEILAWAHEPERRSLGTSEALRIRTDLSAPPNDAATISVRFFDPGEELPGAVR